MISLDRVSKHYHRKSALKNVSLSFKPNKIIGLIGFNGSGKTTTFNIIANVIDDFEGDITVNNIKRDLNFFRRISLLSSSNNEKNTNIVMKQLLYIAELCNTPRQKAIKIIHELADILRFREFLHRSVKSLSKGNQQKIKIINLFLNQRCDFYILDEPFDGLDPIMVSIVTQYLLKHCHDKCIIIASHRLEVIDNMCDEYFLLKDGKIVTHNSKEDKQEESKHQIVTINHGCDLTKIKKLRFVMDIRNLKAKTVIRIKSINDFKKLGAILVQDPNYQYHYLERQKLLDDVFKIYDQ